MVDIWTQKTDFGGIARNQAVGFSIGNKGYVGTGEESAISSTSDFWEYDPTTNSWKEGMELPTGSDGLQRAVGFSIGSKGYIGTGEDRNQNYNADIWEYDPTNDNWVTNSSLGDGRVYAVGFSIGSKGYLGMGDYIPDFWEYDPTIDIWTQKANFAGTARFGSVGFSINSKGYLGTGYTDTGASNDFWEYDPATNAWTQKADFSGGDRDGAVGFSIGSKGYLGTGYTDTGAINDFWEYDPSVDIWTRKMDFGGTARSNAVGFSIGSKGYIGTGSSYPNYYRDFWEYDPAADTWARKADSYSSYRNGRDGAIGFSIGSKGYLGTGYNYDPYEEDEYEDYFFNDFYEYDPASDKWTQKAYFKGTARDGAVGFSIGGKGYIGLGYDGVVGRKDFWEYDPGTILPISFSSFTATKQAGSVLLNWQTATETNNDHFSIERSNKGNDFSAIGQVKSKGVQTTLQQYGFIDAQPFTGENYYRLKQVDADGHFTYSKIVHITFTTTTGYKLYPNPVKDLLQLENLNGRATLFILAENGHIIDKKTVSTSTYSWNVKSLSAGTYYVRIEEDGSINTLKFIKQ